MPAALKNMIALAVIFLVSMNEAVAFSKYGRTCKDIGCPSSEKCVMAEDPCTFGSSQCGSYPTCQKRDSSELSCSTMICPYGQYCKTINGRASCVPTSSTLGHDSAVNAHEANPQNHGTHNTSPYDKASAPLPDDAFGSAGKPYPDSNSGSNYGYPSYSGNSHSSGNNGYPPYPTNHGNQPQPTRNDGYPPYPTNNRMPLPGQSGYPYGQSNYPLHPPPGYPQQPNGQRYPQNSGYPNYNSNYPNQHYPQSTSRNYNSGYRRNAGTSLTASLMMMIVTFGFTILSVSRTGLLS